MGIDIDVEIQNCDLRNSCDGCHWADYQRVMDKIYNRCFLAQARISLNWEEEKIKEKKATKVLWDISLSKFENVAPTLRT